MTYRGLTALAPLSTPWPSAKETWLDWYSGMKENLEKTAFKEVWDEVKMKSSFSFLEELEKTKYNSDPVTWE